VVSAVTVSAGLFGAEGNEHCGEALPVELGGAEQHGDA
jgi:hypothetical protein